MLVATQSDEGGESMNTPSTKLAGLTAFQLILLVTLLLVLQPVLLIWILPSARELAQLGETRDRLKIELEQNEALAKEKLEIQPRLLEQRQSRIRQKMAERLIGNRQTFESLRNSKLPVAIWNHQTATDEIIAKYKTPGQGYFQMETRVTLQGPNEHWKVETFKFPIIANGKGQVSAQWRNEGDEFTIEFLHSDDDSGWHMKKSVTFDQPRTILSSKVGIASGKRFKLLGDAHQQLYFSHTLFYRSADQGGHRTIEIRFDLKEQSPSQWAWLPLIDWNDPKIEQKIHLDLAKEGRAPVKSSYNMSLF